MRKVALTGLWVIFGVFTSLSGFAQTEQVNAVKQAEKKLQKMKKLGYEFIEPTDIDAKMVSMIEKRQEQNEKGENKYLVVELTSKNKDPQIAEDLMLYKLPVELAARITNDILQMIETELVQSNRYWQLGGHDYFLEVQLAIDEVALATAMNLTPLETAYKAKRQNNKNYEYTVGLVYDRARMLDLFIFEAGNYEILDSIYWLSREDEEQ